MLERVKRPFQITQRFLKDVWMELQRVVWPSHDETYAFTGVVIVAVAIISVWIALLDLFFTRLVAGFRLYE